MRADFILHDFDPSLAMLAQPERFRAMMRGGIDRATQLARMDGMDRADAVDSMIAARDLEQILSEVLRDVYGPRYGAQYVPVGSFGIAPWANTYIQKRITRQGLIDYVTTADMPWVNVSTTEISHKLYTLGGQFGWSWFEMQAAQYAGVP